MKCRVLVVAFAFAVPAYAQSGNEGSIEGLVADQTGAVIVGATVTARNLETSASFKSVTDERGMYRFLIVPVGRYDITANHPGFTEFDQRAVLVTVGAKISLPIALSVGHRDEAVTVSSETPLVETTRTSFSSTIDQRSVASLPLNGRNFLNFILLTPGVTGAGGNNGLFFSVTGQSSMSSLLVDGADLNGFATAPVGSAMANRYLFSQEAVQEFQVNTASYSAEFGRGGTAVINVITKSGTNDWRGTAFWYYRDAALNARDPFQKGKGEPETPFYAHQFGGALGGPVVRDRVFFYASYDGQRRRDQTKTILNLPSGFTLSSDPVVAGFQQQALVYLEARAAPYTQTLEQNVFLGKLDWRYGSNHALRASWNRHRLASSNSANPGSDSLEHNGATGQIADTVTVSLTSVLNSRDVNVARFAYVGNHDPWTANSYLPEAIVSEGQQVQVVGRAPKLPVDNGIWRGEWSDVVSITRAAHAVKVGGSLMAERARYFSALNFYGSYRFNSLEKFGRSLSGERGMADRYVQAFSAEGTPPIDVHPNDVEVAGFVQDTWRVRPSLTLDLGLRYEVQIMDRSPVRNDSPALAAAGVDTTFIPTDSNNLAPRFGFAWTPGRSGRSVVRGGYGLYFPRFLPATAARAFFQNGITAQTRTLTGPPIPAYPNTICGAPDPSGAPPICAAPNAGADMIMAIPGNYRQSVIQQGSLGAEYGFARDFAVSVTYLRVKGDALYHWQDINLPEPIATPIGIAGTDTVLTYRWYNSRRPIAGFDRVLLLTTNGYSSYHGLVVQLNKRFSHNHQFAASYTLARTIDDNPTLGALNPGPGDTDLLSDSLAPSLDRGAADYDQRHRFVLSGTWNLDYGKGLAQPARAILNDWEVSGILATQSGRPYSGLLNYDLNNDGNTATDRTPGLGRNTFFQTSSTVLDIRLSRSVHLNGRSILQLTWDVFNVFNRVNFSGVRTLQFRRSISALECGIAKTPCLVPQDSGSSAFGTPTAAQDPRMMQLAAKFLF